MCCAQKLIKDALSSSLRKAKFVFISVAELLLRFTIVTYCSLLDAAHRLRVVNKDKFQIPRPRPRTLFPQGLFKDFCRLSVSLFMTLSCIGLKYIQVAHCHIMLSENPFNATFQNTMVWSYNIMRNVTKRSNKLFPHLAYLAPLVRRLTCILIFHGVTPTVCANIWEY